LSLEKSQYITFSGKQPKDVSPVKGIIHPKMKKKIKNKKLKEHPIFFVHIKDKSILVAVKFQQVQ